MFDKHLVKLALENCRRPKLNNPALKFNEFGIQPYIIPLLLYEIFGGEILKSHYREGWHFYNRIDGERIDLEFSKINIPGEIYHYQDLPSSPDEIGNYIDEEEYSYFYLRFIRAYEKMVGLEVNAV